MQTARNKKRVALYAVCAFFFLLAGVFQAVDILLPEFWHALFALLAHVLLLSLVVAWGVSLLHRMVRKDLLSYFLTVAVLILFFLLVRMVKYGLTEDTDTLSRYLWYSYYLPQCLIPPTILLAAQSLENVNGKPLAKAWYLLYLPALLLLALIYTNDLHQWAFALYFDGGHFSYGHRPVFYAALVWEITVTAAGLAVMILKCSVSACRSKTWIPVCTFAVCAGISAVCFWANTSAFKIPELLCFTCIAVIESCILIGLIPSNDGYEEYFYRSACSAILTDDRFHVIYRSGLASIVDSQTLETAAKNPVMTDENTRFSAERIHGGYVFVCEDLTQINEIYAALREANERLAEENDLMQAENEIRAQKAQVEAQSRLYADMEECTRPETVRLGKFLTHIGQEEQLGGAAFTDKMRFACVLAAYIKRRSNLVMLADKNTLEVGELALSLKESLEYLSLAGTECSLDFGIGGRMDGKTAGAFYDFFEACVAKDDNLPTAVLVHLHKRDGRVVMRLESDANAEKGAAFSAFLKAQFTAFAQDITVETDGETVYCTLSLVCGGVI